MPLSRGTERLSFEAVALETPSITTVAALVKKAEDDPHGNRFITTVRPKNLPEWGIKFEEISPPGCAIDFHLIGLKDFIAGVTLLCPDKEKRSSSSAAYSCQNTDCLNVANQFVNMILMSD